MLRRTVIALVMAFFCAAAVMPSQAEAAGKIGVANPLRLSNQSAPGTGQQSCSSFGDSQPRAFPRNTRKQV